uniref:Integrase zinc-binding domain-containing protein n=1 Tax=Nicotiana tabacum TaxID=4097 RepID=A0A1S4DH46_TOBAC|nr:PREDICTED: uncharacterized protein LOC107829736 [Nicotiana tabacum]
MEEMENENKAFRDQMREHQERVDKIPGAPKLLPKRDAGRFVEQPYSDEAALHAMPKTSKMPPYLKIYDGMIDPDYHIVYALEKLGLKVKWPQKIRSDPSTRKSDALCEFHQERGHKTEDCIALRQEVVNMLQQGYLKELLSDPGRTNFARGRERYQGPLKLPSPTHTIQMIIGGGDKTSINNIKFTTTHKLKRSITHERYDKLEESIIIDKSGTHGLDGVLPDDKKEAKKLRMQAIRYNIIYNDLYKRMYGGPLAKCLGPNQSRRLLEDVYEGHCGAHSGNRALVGCLIRAGYYWPTMKKEAANFVKKCE